MEEPITSVPFDPPLTYRGIEILWDIATTRLTAEPDLILVAPWIAKAIKRANKRFSRRDRRRKHKRYS